MREASTVANAHAVPASPAYRAFRPNDEVDIAKLQPWIRCVCFIVRLLPFARTAETPEKLSVRLACPWIPCYA